MDDETTSSNRGTPKPDVEDIEENQVIHRYLDDALYVFFSVIGSYLGILVLTSLDRHVEYMIIGSFGAQAVLLYAAPTAPLAQPWNCIIGNGVAACIGVACQKLIDDHLWAFPMSVALAILGMHLTKSIHPPGGATALIAVMSPRAHEKGFLYIFFPVMIGSCINVTVSIVINWIASIVGVGDRGYPVYWLPFEM